jgi:general secretion pathway protein K
MKPSTVTRAAYRLSNTQPQRGSALILAMLVAGIVAVLAVQFAQAFVVNATLAESRLRQQRFDTYLEGGEALARHVLWQDWLADQAAGATSERLDHLQETWAVTLPPLATDDGLLEVAVHDLQGLYNLNNLLDGTAYTADLGAAANIRFSARQKQFIRLLQSFANCPLYESEAIAITEALIDWLDEDDQVTGVGGAESLYYISAQPPLAPANRPLRDVSELVLLRHMTPELIDCLRPHVTVLPEITALNVNTAAAGVLSGALKAEQPAQGQGAPPSLAPAGDDTVRALMQLREQHEFDQVATFIASGLAADPQTAEAPETDSQAGSQSDQHAPTGLGTMPPLYAVNSQFFEARLRVWIDGDSRQQRIVLRRDEHGVQVLARYQDVLQTPDAQQR